MSVLSDTIGSGSGSRYKNPIAKPDLSFLDSTAKLNYLKKTNPYQFLMQPVGGDLLKNPTNKYVDALPGGAKSFGETYQAPGFDRSDSLFSDLIGSTGAPSSVDDVRNEISDEQLQQVLAGIDTDADQSIGSIKSDFLDRGLSGPGMISDIEANSLAQAHGDANKTKSAARVQAQLGKLDLLKNRENQNIAAKTSRANAGLSIDQLLNQIAATGAQGDVNSYNSLLGTQANLGEQDLSRDTQRDLSYYDLLNSGRTNYANILNSNNQLFANLLNSRDLGKAGQLTSMYNTGQQLEAGSYQPGMLEGILRNTQIGLNF